MITKICGITTLADAKEAVALGARAIGFIFVKESPRHVSPEQVIEITKELPPFVSLVGVFKDQPVDEVKQIMARCKLTIAQLHGEESPDYCTKLPHRVIKGFRIGIEDDLNEISAYRGKVSAALLDTKIPGIAGGTGQTFDWSLAIKAKALDIPIILAGGINAENIGQAMDLVSPYAIDLCSGVESEPGKKDFAKLSRVLGQVAH